MPRKSCDRSAGSALQYQGVGNISVMENDVHRRHKLTAAGTIVVCLCLVGVAEADFRSNCYYRIGPVSNTQCVLGIVRGKPCSLAFLVIVVFVPDSEEPISG